jgi:pyruvate kinase
MMSRICREAEKPSSTLPSVLMRMRRIDSRDAGGGTRRAVTDAALVLLSESHASALWVFTLSGSTALRVSKLRPGKPVHAFSPREETLRYLSGLWGIAPLPVPVVRTIDEMITAAEKAACAHGLARSGEEVVVLAGQALTKGTTHLIKLHRVV